MGAAAMGCKCWVWLTSIDHARWQYCCWAEVLFLGICYVGIYMTLALKH